MRASFRAAALLILLGAVLPAAARAQANPDWHRAISGFKIAGNLYYVGTADLAAYLVATPVVHKDVTCVHVRAADDDGVQRAATILGSLSFRLKYAPCAPGKRSGRAVPRAGLALMQRARSAKLQ